MRWKRRSRLPAEVRAELDLARGEQVLAGAPDASGQWVVATDDALVLPARRLQWSSIASASWDTETSTLTVETLRVAGQTSDALRVVLPEPGLVPEAVRDRVESSIVASRRFPVRPGADVRVVARRAWGSDVLMWQVVLDPGLDPDDPQVQAASDQGLAELRGELGA